MGKNRCCHTLPLTLWVGKPTLRLDTPIHKRHTLLFINLLNSERSPGLRSHLPIYWPQWLPLPCPRTLSLGKLGNVGLATFAQMRTKQTLYIHHTKSRLNDFSRSPQRLIRHAFGTFPPELEPNEVFTALGPAIHTQRTHFITFKSLNAFPGAGRPQSAGPWGSLSAL
jgi:hypothetical protein